MLNKLILITLLLGPLSATASCSSGAPEHKCLPVLQENGEIYSSRQVDPQPKSAVNDAATYNVYLSNINGHYRLVRESYTQDKTTLIVPVESTCSEVTFNSVIYLTRDISALRGEAEWFGATLILEPNKIDGKFPWDSYISKAESQYHKLDVNSEFKGLSLANKYGLGVKFSTSYQIDEPSTNGVIYFPTAESEGNIPIEQLSCISGCGTHDPILSIKNHKYHFFGMMDKKIPFEMLISRELGKIKGKYRYTSKHDSQWIELSGDIQDDEIILTERVQSKVTGVFHAKLSGNYFVGTWKPDSEGKARNFLAAREF